jgi:hypothetical protein
MKSGMMTVMCAFGLAVALTACSSGGDSDGGSPPPATTTTGTFVDSPVNGLGYRSPSRPAENFTQNGGQFNCQVGELVTFFLGHANRVVGTPQLCSGSPLVVTAVSVLGKSSASDPEVVNLSRLLLTLGGNPAPGTGPITINPNPALLVNVPLTLNFAAQNFDTLFPSLTLVSVQDAMAHLAVSFKTLTVTVTNGGSVTSIPRGITCNAGSSTGCSYSFVTGTVVSLAVAGSQFNGWAGGGCSGTGACIVTINTDINVTAEFGPAQQSQVFHFTWELTRSLIAINPSSPSTTPITVVPNGMRGAEAYVEGSYDPGALTFSNLRATSLVFIQTTGPDRNDVFKIGMSRQSSSLNPGRISEGQPSDHADICGIHPIQNPLGTQWIAYELNGNDGTCFFRDDVVTKMVPLSPVFSGPQYLPPGHRLISEDPQVFDFATGRASYVFVIEGNDGAGSFTLKVLDPNLLATLGSSSLALKTVQRIDGNADVTQILAQDASDRVLLLGGATVYLYTISTNSLTPLLTSTNPLLCLGQTCADGTHLYVSEWTGTAGKIHRIPLTATGLGQAQTIYEGPGNIQEVQLSTNRVLVVTTTGVAGNGLVSIPKAGGAPVTVIPAAQDIVIPRVIVRNDKMFFTVTKSSEVKAHIRREDGTEILQTSGQPLGPFSGVWVSKRSGTSFDLRRRNVEVEKVILLNGPSNTGTPVVAYDATSPTSPPVQLGPLPSMSELSFSYVTSDILDSAQLIIGRSLAGLGRNVLFVDTDRANSIVAVPTPVVFGGWEEVGF